MEWQPSPHLSSILRHWFLGKHVHVFDLFVIIIDIILLFNKKCTELNPLTFLLFFLLMLSPFHLLFQWDSGLDPISALKTALHVRQQGKKTMHHVTLILKFLINSIYFHSVWLWSRNKFQFYLIQLRGDLFQLINWVFCSVI